MEKQVSNSYYPLRALDPTAKWYQHMSNIRDTKMDEELSEEISEIIFESPKEIILNIIGSIVDQLRFEITSVEN